LLVPCCGQPGEFDLDVAVTRLAGAKLARPGAGFVYANSNYVLLAAVTQRVSGKPFVALMRDSVFRPQGMSRTTLDSAEASEWGLAEPHQRRWGKVEPMPRPFLGWHGSSLVKSTARDMASYLQATLASRPSLSEPYDGGWFIRQRAEWPGKPRVLEHGGDTWGGNTAAIVAPAWNMGAVVLLNSGVRRANEMARGVLARAAGFDGPPPRKDPKTSDTDMWAKVFAGSAVAMCGALTVYVWRASQAVRRRERRLAFNTVAVIRGAALLTMAAALVHMLVRQSPPSFQTLPESLRTGLSVLAASSAAVLVVAAIGGLLSSRRTPHGSAP
jgi:CubicO group peptidase (beta-lactamase class C family)